MTDESPWLEIRCQSKRCDVPGGRVLYRQRAGALVSLKHRGSGGVFVGLTVLLLICRCGWRWRNESLTGMFSDIEAMMQEEPKAG